MLLTADRNAAITEAIKAANLEENDRLAVELLKLGPVPIECFSQWVPADPFLKALENPGLPPRYQQQILERLSTETSLTARLAVAESLASPPHLLEKLVGDIDTAVRLSAQYNPQCPPDSVAQVQAQEALASNPTANQEQLAALSQSSWARIQQIVARNPAASEAVLLTLAEEPNPVIREAIARNPSATAPVLSQLLSQLATDTDSLTAIIVAHPNASDALLKEIAKNERYKLAILQRNPLSESMFRFFLGRLTAENNVPLWRNDAWKDRLGRRGIPRVLEQNPSTPTEVIDQLADFEIADIRAWIQIEHPNADPARMERWVEERLSECLSGIASHPNASASRLETIANQTDDIAVQAALAYNEHAPQPLRLSAFDKLVNYSDDRQLTRIAANLATPSTVLQKISQACLGEEPGLQAIQSVLRGQASTDFLKAVQSFLAQHSDSAEQVLFWLRQDRAFSAPIVQEWAEMRSKLSAMDSQLLDILSNLVPHEAEMSSRDRWVMDDPDALSLYGFLMFFTTRTQSQGTSRNWTILLALVGNPNTPAELRESLTQQALAAANEDRSKIHQIYLALALNDAVPELERAKHFERLMDGYNRTTREALAISEKTPLPVLLKIIEASQKQGIIWQSVAKNPNTPIEYLEELAQDKNQTTVDYVRANPGAPIELLRKIASGESRYYALERNPWATNALASYLGEAEYYQRQIALQDEKRLRIAQEQLLKRKNSSYMIAQVLKSRNPQAMLLAARNQSAPLSVIETIAQDEDPELRRAVIGHPNLSEACLLQLSKDEDTKVQRAVAYSRQLISAAVIQSLMDSSDAGVLEAIAKRTDVSTDVLDTLASSPHRSVKIQALSNRAAPTVALQRELPNIKAEKTIEIILRGNNNKRDLNLRMPPDLLEHYSQYDNKTIRFLVARYPNANITTLERLAFDSYSLVKETIAENPSTPFELLIQMAQHAQVTTTTGSYHTVSSHICRRKDAPPEALDSIVRQSVSSIRQTAVKNANLSAQTLDWLAEHETNETVLKGIVVHPNVQESTLVKLADQKSVAVRAAIAAQPNCPTHILLRELLAQTPSLEVWLAIASNPSTPTENLDIFVNHETASLRAAVAANPSLSTQQIEQLAADDKIEVKRALANNQSTPEDLKRSLKRFIIQANAPDTPALSPTLQALPRQFSPSQEALPELLADYFESDNDFVRLVVLLNPQTPIAVLSRGAQSHSWLERYAVAENSATPTEIRQTLTKDEHPLVSIVAQSIAY